MEKYFNLGRAYYTYLKSSTKKDQCTVSVICDNIDIKHNIPSLTVEKVKSARKPLFKV